MIRAGLIALVLLAAAACGKYGPPVRTAVPPASNAPEVSAPQAPGDTEECPDPNAPAKGVGQAP